MDPIRPDWPAPKNVGAAMSTRLGGVSIGGFASLNLGIGADDPAAVAENRRRLREALSLPAEPGWLKQVHGTTVVRLAPFEKGGRREAAGGFPKSPPAPLFQRGEDLLPPSPPFAKGGEPLPEADASYATGPGAVCVVQAADCLPVLFCDDAGTVVAAAHAGWRGLAAGVLEATVRAMAVRPASLMAWLGAAIGPDSFEVGAEVRDAFVSQDARAAACFVPAPFAKGGRREAPGGFDSGKFLADLYALARQRLAAAGVAHVFGGGLDTHRDAGRFYSYRRDGRCGRMAALVWLGDADPP